MKKNDLYEKLANEELGIEDIMTNTFMEEYTNFSSFKSFVEELEERGSRRKEKKEKILQDVITEKTTFKNFEKMKERAIEDYCKYN